jgi:hypothetical protein
MDWISTLHYGLILQQERLRRAREPWRGFSVPMGYKWLRAVRQARRARRARAKRSTARITPASGPALPGDGAPA